MVQSETEKYSLNRMRLLTILEVGTNRVFGALWQRFTKNYESHEAIVADILDLNVNLINSKEDMTYSSEMLVAVVCEGFNSVDEVRCRY